MSEKKIVIKPFRPNVVMNDEKAKQIWEALNKAIREIHNKNASSLSFEELYRNAYNLVLHKHAELLYDGVASTVTIHLKDKAIRVTQVSDDQLLAALCEVWSDHKMTMMMIRDILMYMDRTYVAQNRKVPVYDMGLFIFRNEIARHNSVKDRLRHLLLEAIKVERNGELVDRGVIKKCLSMLVDVGVHSSVVYEEDFEREFLEATLQYYRTESQRYLDHNTCPDYLKKAEERIREETSRVTHYLNTSTEGKLLMIVEAELIKRHALSLVDMEGSGCNAMFRDDKLDDLSRMYTLFTRVPEALQELRKCMQSYIITTGEELIRNQLEVKDAVKFVKDLLQLRDKFDGMVKISFRNDSIFQKTLKDGFEGFINNDTTCSSYLAQYVDELLRSGGLKGLNEEDFDALLDKVVSLFRYLQDKDIFEEYYKRYLSKRLLSGRSQSDEVEKSMISKLKAECGYQFTCKMEGMFKDMKMSKDTMDGFRRHVETRRSFAFSSTINEISLSSSPSSVCIGGSNFELSVHVLTTGFWPTENVKKCTLPAEVQPGIELYQDYYFGKHSGRRLSWQTNMGNADIKAVFATGRNELNVSTYQMCILLLFNASNSISFHEIQEATNIPERDLRRHLISLCTPKYRILRKSSKGKAILDSDEFQVNNQYKSKLHRVRIPLVSMKETTCVSTVPEPVAEDRKHLVEAAIVRIMKTRKSMQHNNLIAEVTKHLSSRFSPSPILIKRRVESLIEREYLERSKSDRRIYNYLA